MAGMRGRKPRRGRGGRRAVEETHQQHSCNLSFKHEDSTDDQGYPFSPSSSTRSRTRHSRVLDQLATVSSTLRSPVRSINKKSGHSSSLNLAMITLTEPLPGQSNSGMPELQQFISHLSGEDRVSENAVEPVKLPLSDGCSNWCNPTSEHQQDQDVVFFLPFHGPQEAQLASHQEQHGNDQPSTEDNVGSHVEVRLEKSTTSYVHKSTSCLSKSQSLNVTEYARKLQDDIDEDPEEVESALGPAFDCVNGHKVRIEVAPLLRAIFEKYGDITRGNEVKSSAILSIFLELICDIYERLEQTNFFDVTHIDLDKMLEEVRYLERQKLNVRWLLEKLEYIYDTKIKLETYSSIKEEAAKIDTSIRSTENQLELYELEVSLLQQRISAAKKDLEDKKAKSDQIKKEASDIKARFHILRKQTLVHGLL